MTDQQHDHVTHTRLPKNPLKAMVALAVALLITPLLMLVKATFDDGMAHLRMLESHSNHARFEGTWAPHELMSKEARYWKARRQGDFPAAHNHRAIEGYA